MELLKFIILMIYLTLNFAFYNNRLFHENYSYQVLHGKTKSSNQQPKIIIIEDLYSDSWQLENISKILQDGGLGVICTDTCYSFITLISSPIGVKRLMKLKGSSNQKKPLSLICKDLSMVSMYTQFMKKNWIYKLLKQTLPGPFTYILPASKLLPKIILEGKVHIKIWKRKEIGIRIPNEPIINTLFEYLQEPLLCGSVPCLIEEDVHDINLNNLNDDEQLEENNNYDDDDDDEISINTNIIDNDDEEERFLVTSSRLAWHRSVDFIVDAGYRGGISGEYLTTVIDLTKDDNQPHILRVGKGILPL